MSCCDGCIKYLLFIFNLIFSLSGLALIIIGSILLANISDFSSIITDISSGLTAPQITIIVVGVIIFLIATLGCCGAIRENRCMLITFAVLLLSIFIVELAIGIYAVVNFSDLKEDIDKGLRKSLDSIKNDNDDDARKPYDALQKAFECCGASSYQDWTARGMRIPDSCCKEYKEGCSNSQQANLFFVDGCTKSLTNFSSKAGKILGGVAIALSLIEIIGAIFALRLASQAS